MIILKIILIILFLLKELNLKEKSDFTTKERVSVTDKKFKLILLNFINIIKDFSNPSTFVRIIKNSQYVYENGIRELSKKKDS